MRIAIMALSSVVLVAEGQLDNEWRFRPVEDGKKALTYRTAVSSPKESGNVTLSIEKGSGDDAGIKMAILIESPFKIANFPFELFEGPADKERGNYILFRVVSGKHAKDITCIPSGGYSAKVHGGFLFSTVNLQVISFLKSVDAGSRLLIQIHASKGELIEIGCVTDGLKEKMKNLDN